MKYFLLTFSLVFAFATTGLSQDRATIIDQAVAEQTALYSLDDQQQEEMHVIESRRLNNLEAIAPIEQTDYRLYLQKKRALRVNTQGSIRRMLNTEQREIQDELLVQYRIETSEMIRQMRSEGKTKEELELLMMERG